MISKEDREKAQKAIEQGNIEIQIKADDLILDMSGVSSSIELLKRIQNYRNAKIELASMMNEIYNLFKNIEPKIIMTDAEKIKIIEKALGTKLSSQQIEYIFNDGTYWYGWGRGNGRTTAYIIKLALSEGKPLDMKRPSKICDEDYGLPDNKYRYAQWFREKFLDIYYRLKEAGLKVREIKI